MELITERMTTTATDDDAGGKVGDSPLVFSTQHAKLYCGDSRRILREQLAPESIHMCMCSPPYYGLRDYGLQPVLWDGRAGCNHEFQTRHYKLHAGRGDAQKSGKYSEQESIPDREMQDELCVRCGAWKGQLGQEPKIGLYIRHLLQIFDEVKRVLRPDGTLWVNLGDSYGNGGGEMPEKSLSMIPERFALSMIERGWILRSKIVWHKPNGMPQSAKDKFTSDWEPIFLFAKNQKYYFATQYEPYQSSAPELERGARFGGDQAAGYGNRAYSGNEWDPAPETEIPGRIKRSVWSIPTHGYAGQHFAAYPPEICETPIKAGCPESGGGIVLDPFAGSGATGVAALKLARNFIGIDISPEFCRQAVERLKGVAPDHRLDGFL
jgi:site-specific DNA-methyltransferase (cytosine-N4-specific)